MLCFKTGDVARSRVKWPSSQPSSPPSPPVASVPSLAPAPGKHVLHAYYAANEPWEPWANVKRGSEEYRQLKEERGARLWEAVEQIIPDIKQRVEVEMVGSPLTHARFLRRHEGTYGPPVFAPIAKGETVPFAATPVPGANLLVIFLHAYF